MTCRDRTTGRWRSISTHILTKRMTLFAIAIVSSDIFQLTSSRRGWLIFFWFYLSIFFYFNSHPHEEDDSVRYNLKRHEVYFNSHPHEEDDCGRGGLDWDDVISTHILTKRMTQSYQLLRYLLLFQLTSSRRGWQRTDKRRGSSQVISTHILTKRMTFSRIDGGHQ